MKPKDDFLEVCSLIESGFTIGEAFEELNLDSRKFYNYITQDQRIILSQLRTANKLYGMPDNGFNRMDTKDLHEFFTSNDYV